MIVDGWRIGTNLRRDPKLITGTITGCVGVLSSSVEARGITSVSRARRVATNRRPLRLPPNPPGVTT